jgi:uncharacterized protein (TIGR00288 family)
MVSNGGAGPERQVAVLIDFENVGLNSIQWLFDQISDIGRITIKRAYSDWSSVTKGTQSQVLELGIEPIQLFRLTGAGKNSSDIRIVIDAIDLLYQSPIDTFVIVSSDSDFVPLVSKLRAGGKSVIGAGRRATASRALVISCDRYHYLDEDSKPLPEGNKIRRRPRTPVAEEAPTEILLLRAMSATMDEEGRVAGSKLHQTMQRLDPSFNFRSLGYSTLTKYLEASSEVKVTRPHGAGDVNVELADLGAPPASPAAAPLDSETWGPKVDAAWAERAPASGQSISGHAAASTAASVLGFQKLSASQYKTIQKLLDASEHLNSRWSRDRNTVIRR